MSSHDATRQQGSEGEHLSPPGASEAQHREDLKVRASEVFTTLSEEGNEGSYSADRAAPLPSEAGWSAAQHSDGWRDIDSAPKDGTSILLLIGGDVHQGSYDGPSDGAIYSGSTSRYNWFSESEGVKHLDRLVSHWMPLPPPPAENRAIGAEGTDAVTLPGITKE